MLFVDPYISLFIHRDEIMLWLICVYKNHPEAKIHIERKTCGIWRQNKRQRDPRQLFLSSLDPFFLQFSFCFFLFLNHIMT